MKASHSIAAVFETATKPPVLPTPRYVLGIRDGSQYLLADDRTPLYFRRSPGLPSERVSPGARIGGVVSERDLWGASHPSYDRGLAWDIGRLLQQWRVRE